MESTIVTEIIQGLVTVIGSILGFIGVMYTQKKKSYEAHIQAQEDFRKSIEDKLDEHRKDYLGKISDVEHQVRLNLDELSEIKANTQTWQSTFELRFENLSEKVSKHNNFMERLQKAELDIAVLQNREKVSEHRLTDLEGKSHEET